MSKPNPTSEVETAISTYVKLIRAAEVLHAEVSRGLAQHGITATQFSTLKALRFRGPLPQRDIASLLFKTGGNVTVVVDNLERRGLVVRTRDEEDRRVVFVKLTPEGQKLYDRIHAPHLERIHAAMSTLDDCECQKLTALLEKLAPTSKSSKRASCSVNLFPKEV